MVGMRAMESLRIEKSYRMWGSDLTPDYTPFEAGLDRFVRMDKGRLHRPRRRSSGSSLPACRIAFVTLEVHGVTDADPLGNEPLFDREGRSWAARRRAATATCSARASRSATWSRHSLRSAATSSIEMLGERKRATVLVESPFDPDNLHLKA